MKTTFVFNAAIAALLFAFALPDAHAAMYRWVDEEGSVVYSNTPPEDRSKVRELTKIWEAPVTAPAPKTQALVGPQSDPLFASAPAKPAESPPPPQIVITPTDPPARAEAPRPVARSLHTEAVRDPCLISSDPKCHERHKDRYHPRLGHAPGALQGSGTGPAVGPAVGATRGAAAGGVVGGAVAAPVRR